MTIKSYKLLSFSFLVALPFLGGVTECTPTEPEPEPEPELCLADADCAAGEYCNFDLCLSPCRDGEACPAVCYGACEPSPPPPPPPELCLSDADCGVGAYCNVDLCLGGCPDGDAACPLLCYGACEPLPPPPPPEGCLDDADCGPGARCNLDECLPVPCGDDGNAAHPAVCYGICEPEAPVCDPVLCDLFCEGGFVVDERGCEICACNPPPPPACEPVACDIWCEHGFVVDERGCEICACNPPPPEASCGGFAGFTCGADEWCDYPADVPACGAADHLGVCRPRPDACPFYYGPVCGCDGVTYDNECFAHAAGVDVSSSGLCASPTPAR
ncbi:MAG: Kazal-type serine protease inhibitor domain-containing protein [Sandaracinaceae bacterium]